MNQVLVFGCSKLTSHFTRSAALGNLSTAYDCGIKDFDVARSYGYGAAEAILGDFAQTRRGAIHITGKAGIEPAYNLSNLVLQNVLRRSSHVLSKSNRGRMVKQTSFSPSSDERFSITKLKHSLQKSLRELKTSYLDRFLLHESTTETASGEEITSWLLQLRREGVIRKFGIGSYHHQVKSTIKELPNCYQVLQIDCSFPEPFCLPLETIAEKDLFLFSPFSHFTQIQQLIRNNRAIKKDLDIACGFDVVDHAIALFLIQPMLVSDRAHVLFSSRNNQNIRKTVSEFEFLKKHLYTFRPNVEILRKLLETINQ